MNSINSISKYKYNSKVEYPVNLDEYIILRDESNDEKYLLFKFFNTLSEHVHHMDLNIKLFNENNFMIENIDLSFDGDFKEGYFAPEKKLKISSEFMGIKVIIKKITFDTLYFEKDEIKKIPIKLTTGTKEENNNQNVSYKKKSKWEEKKDKLEYETTKRNIELINKRRYVTNASNVNRTKLGIILTAIFSVIVILYFVGTMVLFAQTSKLLFDGVLVYMVEKENVCVVDVENGKEPKSINIPDKIENMQVTEVSRDAFKDLTSLEKVTFNAEITIRKNAFSGCSNLKEIVNPNYIYEIEDEGFRGTRIIDFNNYDNLTYLGKDAFSDVEIDELYFPRLVLKNDSLSCFKNLYKLTYNNLSSATGLSNVLSKESINTLKEIATYDKHIKDEELLGTNVSDVTLLSKDAKITSDKLFDGSIKRLALTMSDSTLSTIIGGANTDTSKINLIEIRSIVATNDNFFNGTYVKNVAITTTTNKLSSINLPNSIETMYLDNSVNLDYTTYYNYKDTSLKSIYYGGYVSYQNNGKTTIINNYNYDQYIKNYTK